MVSRADGDVLMSGNHITICEAISPGAVHIGAPLYL